MQEPFKAQLFMTCSELEQGKITITEFRAIMQSCCALSVATTVASLIPGASEITSAGLGLMNAIDKAAANIKDRAETAKMSVRYLSGLITAEGLAPESIRVVVAVKEAIENSLDGQEVIRLQAEINAVRGFMQEDVAPFLKVLNGKPSGSVSVSKIREKRSQVKAKLEAQRTNVDVYLQLVMLGLSHMQQETYSRETNHLPRYAAACAIEILLHAYYTNLGMFDPEDFMVEHDLAMLKQKAFDRCQGEHGIGPLFSRYSEERMKLLTTKFEYGPFLT